MTYKPTFKPSPQKRPWYRRLTPLAWALIGVAALVLLLACVGGSIALTDRLDEGPWDPTPTASPVPTDTPVPTTGPSPTPTEWWAGMISPTPEPPEPTPAFPAWWSDEMTQDEDGRWWPPEEITEMVREHYDAGTESYYAWITEGEVPDLDGLEADLPNWYSGPQLEQEQLALEAIRQGEWTLAQASYDQCILEVQDWSADGLECTLGCTCQDGLVRHFDLSGLLVETEEVSRTPLALIRMHYDPFDGHWKRHELLDIIEVP